MCKDTSIEVPHPFMILVTLLELFRHRLFSFSTISAVDEVLST